MKYDDRKQLIKSFVASLPKLGTMYHESPSEDAYILAKIIAAIDSKYGPYFDFGFGGDGDSGEVIATILDMLIERGVILLSLEALGK